MGIIVNLFGGPSIGKSTTAAGVFTLLKMNDVNAELVTEFAKDLTWEDRQLALNNQYYVWAKQYHKLHRVIDQVDIVITDGPLIFSLIYGTNCEPSFYTMVLNTFNEFDNINFFLDRVKKFNPVGRNQTEEESISLDDTIVKKLCDLGIGFDMIRGDYTGINDITHRVLKKINKDFKYSMFGYEVR